MKTFETVTRSRALGLALAVVGLTRVVPAGAGVINFTLDAQGGNSRISYAGPGRPLAGKDLGVVMLKGVDTPSNNGVAITVSKGALNFTTGPNVDADKNGPLRQWEFAAGGDLVLTGGVPSLGIPDGTLVLPGHGPATTVGQERRTNPYVGDKAGPYAID